MSPFIGYLASMNADDGQLNWVWMPLWPTATSLGIVGSTENSAYHRMLCGMSMRSCEEKGAFHYDASTWSTDSS